MSDELEALRESLRDFLATKSDARRVVDGDAAYDRAIWRQMAEQLGLQSLVLPGDYGGDGYGFAELRVVMEEMGRALLPSAFLSSVVMGASALVASGDATAQSLHLPALAAGDTTATFAVAEGAGSWDLDEIGTRADREGDHWTLTGEKSLVVDGATAELVLVVARTGAGPSLFAVTGDAEGLTRAPLRALDPTRKIARLTFAGTPAVLVGTDGGAGPVVERVLRLTEAALAAEQVGGARACLEASAVYARERRQFGRAIGSFQAVKHKCAEMLSRVELAQAAATEAADAVDSGDAAAATAVAHAVCSEAFMFVAAENIQVHGGIGFTWEHPAHLYYRRAKSSQLLLGGPAVYYERMLRRLGV
ncbi:acyl-CoA dehydrogenase family protein [Cryptosporangium sp. NPDC051539]|uniref:acyl-CoA dehydrogenase family protein n=1 Tax=Cryptosporangium sp. NPDC051539 TaxID=3363962 RepID=UPI0037A41181